MEYRAQLPGRCQRQRIQKPKNPPPGWQSDIQRWINEWVKRVDASSPFSSDGLRIVEVQIDWRLISNSGVDEGVIRPVIGAGGWPLIPGSGIKGLFRRACPPHRLQRWCGSSSTARTDSLDPGILRFHGAWPSEPATPADADWREHLLDLAHPQQNWQIGFSNGREGHSAFGVASLYRPRLRLGLSSSDPTISETEWAEVIETLRQALRAGIGGRTCVGYGTSGRLTGEVLFQCRLEGQGPAAKRLDLTPEFRPTMFRAAIRGMALRLFGGLTDQQTALRIVGQLFGSLSGEGDPHVGLLATAYTDAETQLGSFGRDSWAQAIYATSGLLQWRQMRAPIAGEDLALLADLLAALHGLTISLAGFGRGWRRPDHRIFHANYNKTPIGCHWQWGDPSQLPSWIHVQSPADLKELLRRAQNLASRWLQAMHCSAAPAASWREVIQPQRMLIWTREASDPHDARAIEWFHWAPGSGGSDQHPDAKARELKGTDLAGRVNQVGRIWNRLLPLGSSPRQAAAPRASATARPANPMARPNVASARPQAPRGEVSIPLRSDRFLEILVLFPDRALSPAFIRMMDHGGDAGFERLQW